MGYLHVQDSGQGLEMELAAGGAPLSAGQKQLAALARALLQHSKASQIGTLFLGLHASLSPQQLESSWRRWPGRCSSTPRQATTDHVTTRQQQLVVLAAALLQEFKGRRMPSC